MGTVMDVTIERTSGSGQRHGGGRGTAHSSGFRACAARLATRTRTGRIMGRSRPAPFASIAARPIRRRVTTLGAVYIGEPSVMIVPADPGRSCKMTHAILLFLVFNQR